MNTWLESEQERAMELFLENQKAQERFAIRALIAVNKTRLLKYSKQLQTTLTNQSEGMKEFSEKTLLSDLEGAFKGKAADAAKEYLQKISQPNLNSPIK